MFKPTSSTIPTVISGTAAPVVAPGVPSSAAAVPWVALVDARLVRVLLLAGAVVVTAVWWLQHNADMLTPWDRVMLPILAVVVGACGIGMVLRPQWQASCSAISLVALNVHLVCTLHSILLFGEAALQWFQFTSVLHWMPLAYGCTFIILSARAAIWLSGLAYLAVFAPTLLWHASPVLPGVSGSPQAMLTVIALAHGMFLLVMLAVVVLRQGQIRAEQSAHGFRHQAQTDALTGLPNRRALELALTEGLAGSQHGGVPMAVALIDIDHFKHINDSHGHAMGDAVLRELGPLMQAELRASDCLGRWGGEEFLLLAHGLPMSAAAALAERVREAVQAHAFAHGEPVTVSIGMAQVLAHDTSTQLLQRTDRALYRAKEGGRNRTETRTVEAA